MPARNEPPSIVMDELSLPAKLEQVRTLREHFRALTARVAAAEHELYHATEMLGLVEDVWRTEAVPGQSGIDQVWRAIQNVRTRAEAAASNSARELVYTPACATASHILEEKRGKTHADATE